MEQKKALLLLSGGKDSLLAIDVLQKQGFLVSGLCINGIQGIEKIGAKQAAEKFSIPLTIVSISFFDETTWNPVKLIVRDLAMGIAAIKEAKKIEATYIATGVKFDDIKNPSLRWLKYFIKFGDLAFAIFGIKLIFPVWNEVTYDSN